MKGDIRRARLTEAIEDALVEYKNNGSAWLEDTKIELVSEGLITITASTGIYPIVYEIRVSRKASR